MYTVWHVDIYKITCEFDVSVTVHHIYTNWILTNSAHDYTPTPQDHSLNTYGITPHAAVKQPIYKNS